MADLGAFVPESGYLKGLVWAETRQIGRCDRMLDLSLQKASLPMDEQFSASNGAWAHRYARHGGRVFWEVSASQVGPQSTRRPDWRHTWPPAFPAFSKL